MKPRFAGGFCWTGVILQIKCPGPTERCDPKTAPSTRDRGERRYGDDRVISQAGDGLRDVREEWPAFRMTERCQVPSGNENRRSVCVSKATTGVAVSGQVRTGRKH